MIERMKAAKKERGSYKEQFDIKVRRKEGVINIVVPVCNEEAVIKELYGRLQRVLDSYGLDWELIFVEDSSSDRTVRFIRELSAQDARVKAIFLTRSFGHHIAITAGLDNACGDHIVMMDGDLQHRPEDIPRLLNVYFEGFDVVVGRRITREPWKKQVGSKILNFLINKLSDHPVDFSSGMFRVISKKVKGRLCTMQEKSRFLLGMIDWLGYPSAEVDIKEDARIAGKTKYSFLKSLSLALNWTFSFSTRPLRLAIYVGAIIAVIGFVWAGVYIFLALFFERPFPGYASLFVSILSMGGLIILLIGILGEYIARIFIEQQNRPIYIVRDRLNFGNLGNGKK